MITASGPGLGRARPAQLADREAEQHRGGGEPAEALGVGAAARAARPRRRSAWPPSRSPRPIARHGLQQREDVAEQQREERHADPEADVDRGRREVLALRVRAEQAGVGGDEEDDDAEQAAAAPRARAGSGTAPGRASPSGAAATSRARARRTRRPARPPRRRRTASRGSAGRRGRRSRGRRGARAESMNDNGPADAGPFVKRVIARGLRALRVGRVASPTASPGRPGSARSRP